MQLAFVDGELFLRLCRHEGQPGYMVPIDTPEDAFDAAAELCDCWRVEARRLSMWDFCDLSREARNEAEDLLENARSARIEAARLFAEGRARRDVPHRRQAALEAAQEVADNVRYGLSMKDKTLGVRHVGPRPDPSAYAALRRHIASPRPRRFFHELGSDFDCLQRIGPDPHWSPSWEGVGVLLSRMSPDAAAATATIAQEIAIAMLGQEPAYDVEDESPDAVAAYHRYWQASGILDRESRLIAAGLMRRWDNGGLVYEPNYYAVRLRRDAALATILAAADAMAVLQGADVLPHLVYSPFVQTGSRVDVVVGSNRSMELFHDPSRHDPIDPADEDLILADLMPEWTDEDSWRVGMMASELGRPSDLPFITTFYSYSNDEDDFVVGPVWLYTDYSRFDPVEELRNWGSSRQWTPEAWWTSEVRASPSRQAFFAGRTPAHIEFLDFWWRVCRCRFGSGLFGSF